MVLKKKTITTLVVEHLREGILSRKLVPGQPLRQDAIAAELSVSRIPVREALLQLEAEGLVKIIPHKGAIVTEVDPAEVQEIFDLREMLECDIFKRAFSSISREDLDRAEDILDEFKQLLRPDADVSRWSALNWEFHKTLYEPAHKDRTLELINRLHSDCNRYLQMQIAISDGYKLADKQHRDLVKLCRQKKKKEAMALLKEHIRETGRSLISAIEQ